MISQNISKSILAIICAVTTAAAAGCSASPAKPGQTTQVEQTAEAEQDDSQTAEAEQDDSQTAEAEQDDSQAAGADWDAGQTTQAAEETPEETEQEDPPIQTIETEAYIEKLVPVYDGQMTDMKVPLRFFKETPNVAYMGIGEYFELMLGGGLEVKPAEGEGDAGKYILTNRSGASAEVDIEKGIMSIEDLPSFENYIEPAQRGEPKYSFRDSDAPYVRIREVVYLDEPQLVELDFASCGIALHSDDSNAEVWYPVSILGSLLSDIAQNTVSYNGKRLYICRQRTGYEQDRRYFDTDYINGIVDGQDRAEDLTAYSYGELCFIFRYLYGYPGRADLDTDILREEGFDAALAAAGEKGDRIREELKSRSFREFWKGMYGISQDVLQDGHNGTELVMDFGDPLMMEKRSAFSDYTDDITVNAQQSEFMKGFMGALSGIYQVRRDELQNTHYYKCGDTEVICFNSFDVSAEEWKHYYEEGGDLPRDTMGIVAEGLRKAQEDPEIRNVLFDTSTNTGGFSDAEIGILSLISGKEYLAGYNELSKQRFRVYFDVDRNLDGVFDEKDKEVDYDFHYGALISRGSFSCGNLFPFLVREAGGVLIGERSGGGSCSVQVAVLSEGFEFRISGYKFKLTDDAGSDLEAGAAPDIEIEVGTETTENEFTGEEMTTRDYSKFGDIEWICGQVRDWYAQK